ncbi:carboxypeptidase-like regulatory domain-containing protein [Rhodohalobacter sp.]|uniref:carboxypeptidase-like regulatory domain-containing protein n=1 Tax=Rhodohalobacter sp. TaxID=1974210 RepID=UPI002ACDDC62|nr:carboxypeptidase-like regulatory domain-containing protein [Rhodohalobacter sp.]MDZ7756769.1 carboxypeptidase-like regulatory domain-containing protein [Rhodohalobacter sp.]
MPSFYGVSSMHRAIFILLIATASFHLSGNMELLHAQSTVVEGSLMDSETNQPLQGAHIFLSGTSIGTYSNKSGRFALWNIPTGSYRIIITMIGYERKIFRLDIEDGESRNFNLRLKPVVYEMEDLIVDHQGKKWRKNLRRFQELFIGESANADSVVILNPEVLHFDSNFWGRLEAEARAPLEIVNKSLGFHITYYLFEFRHVGGTTFWDGEPVFTEMTPSDLLQQILWDYNRFKAFQGSMRHFWLAVLDDRVEEEGFTIYKIWDPAFPGDRERRFTVSPEDIITRVTRNS